MSILVLFLSLFSPDARNLCVDSWEARENWSARYSNPICSALLPVRDEDPEIDFRLKAIHRRYGIEPLIKAIDYSLWIKVYVLDGDSGIQGTEAVFYELHADHQRADKFFALAPAPVDWGSWLRADIVPGEYKKFRDHVAKYRSSKGK